MKAANSAHEVKEQTKSENSKEPNLHPQSSDGKTARALTEKTLPLKPTSKLVALKQKEETTKRESGTQNLLSKEKNATGKEEKRTPKKEKISPKKAEVGAVHVNVVGLVELTGKQFSVLIVCISLLCPDIFFLYLLDDF